MIYTIYRDIIIIKIEIVGYNIGILQYLQFNEYICLYKNTLNEDLIFMAILKMNQINIILFIMTKNNLIMIIDLFLELL